MSVIENAAHAVALARQTATTATAALAEARADVDRVRQRVAALAAERASIIAATRSGDADPKRALRLAVIDADVADLAPMVAEADAEVTKAQAADADAGQAVVRAEQVLTLVADEELQRQLVHHVDRLAELTLQTLSELRAVWQRRGARPTWAPPADLARELTRLRLVADGRAAP